MTDWPPNVRGGPLRLDWVFRSSPLLLPAQVAIVVVVLAAYLVLGTDPARFWQVPLYLVVIVVLSSGVIALAFRMQQRRALFVARTAARSRPDAPGWLLALVGSSTPDSGLAPNARIRQFFVLVIVPQGLEVWTGGGDEPTALIAASEITDAVVTTRFGSRRPWAVNLSWGDSAAPVGMRPAVVDDGKELEQLADALRAVRDAAAR